VARVRGEVERATEAAEVHKQRYSALQREIKDEVTGVAATTSAPGLGSPLPHLHRDCAHRCPHLHRDWGSQRHELTHLNAPSPRARSFSHTCTRRVRAIDSSSRSSSCSGGGRKRVRRKARRTRPSRSCRRSCARCAASMRSCARSSRRARSIGSRPSQRS
jgi:hypothetical protein